MKMKLITLGVAALLAAGSVGMAYALPTNLVQNGDFSATGSLTAPSHSPVYTSQQLGWKGFSVDHWTGSGYTIWYPSASAAVTGCGYTQYHYPSSSSGDCSTLNMVGTVPNKSGSFVALDGVQNSLQGSIRQTLSGLTAGNTYAVSFYWGTTQETQASSQVLSHEQYLQVSLAGTSRKTNEEATTWGDFNGWFHTTLNFKAGASNILQFMSFGLPSDGPPMILLTNVSVKAVPEPPELAMFGIGLLGLGLVTVFARRRALRHDGAGSDIG